MRNIYYCPPENRRPDSQDPVIYDELSPEWFIKPWRMGASNSSQLHPRYDELVETMSLNPKKKKKKKKKNGVR